MSAKKEGKKWSISARIDGDLHRRICHIGYHYGVSDAQMITDALDALCDYVALTGKYKRPVKMVLDEAAAAIDLAAEDAAVYGANPPAQTGNLVREELARAKKHAAPPPPVPPPAPPSPPESPPAGGGSRGKK